MNQYIILVCHYFLSNIINIKININININNITSKQLMYNMH